MIISCNRESGCPVYERKRASINITWSERPLKTSWGMEAVMHSAAHEVRHMQPG